MKIFTKTVGILSVLCVVEPSMAALRTGSNVSTAGGANTGRISIATAPGNAAARRLPTIVKATAAASTGSSSSTSSSDDSSLLDRDSCIEQYTDCIKDSEVCGPNFESCTTKELFYAKKPQCNSVLLQCASDGITALFGTGNITDLSSDNIETYPTNGSLLGQYIEAGHINNRYDTGTCVKRVTSCLHRDNACGAEFELCTTTREFKKQRVFCESDIARCQEDGIKELFGSTDASSEPVSESRLRILIDEGADLARHNATATCHRVADQCIMNACKANPYKCIKDSSATLVSLTDSVMKGIELDESQVEVLSQTLTNAAVNSYIRNACMDTIGGNKYCYMTMNDGAIPSSTELLKEEVQEDVYDYIYEKTMNAVMRGKIQDLANEFDRETRDKCVDTMMACVKRTCGGGVGSVCYSEVYGANGPNSTNLSLFKESINDKNTYNEIQRGCEAIVNTDANCQYAAAKSTSYDYNNTGVFATLFPKYSSKSDDPIGVVAKLNADLANNYNAAAIEKLADNCRADVETCITDECGSDFTRCYRNRSDIMSDTYGTTSEGQLKRNAFDASMNKVGGVLDFTVIRGLCIRQVQNSSACKEYLDIKVATKKLDEDTTAGGMWNTTARGYTLQEVEYNDADDKLCVADTSDTCSDENASEPHDCDTTENGCMYKNKITYKDYLLTLSTDTLFREVLNTLEKYVQGQYNAKLTEEQNMCRNANAGGIMGRNDMASTYMWVKLNSKKVPKNYSVNGLKESEFKKSNDLYGSFCRARVTVQSDDPDVQRYLQDNKSTKDWSTAYFAVGDVFTCGSWIPQKDLEKIANRVACNKAKKEGTLKRDEDCNDDDVIEQVGLTTGQRWARFAAGIGGAGIGIAGMELLQTQTGLGGLIGTQKNTSSDKDKLQKSLTKAKAFLRDYCSDETEDVDEFYVSHDNVTVGDVALRSFKTSGKDADKKYSCAKIKGYTDDLDEAINGKSDGQTWWNRGNNGRLVTDAIGAAGMATLGALAVGRNVKAANRQEFTKDQQEFMNNVGNHIYCFIGADEAGTYGDLIEISLD